jgi:predicted ATP-dependent endonuclease of OLD family
MLHAIIGANSAGKSTLLMALNLFFGASVKLDTSLFHGGQVDEPIVIEVTLTGEIEQPTMWHANTCVQTKSRWALTLASVWTADQRFRLIRHPDGLYQRQTPRDRAEVEKLLPEWRVIWADQALNQEASLERKGLLSDLIDALLAQAGTSDNVLARLAVLMQEMEHLLARPVEDNVVDSKAAWEPILALEEQLAQGLASITPQQKHVRLQLAAGLPTLRNIISQSVLSIDDGMELALDQHGLGMQRSLVVSILRTWCDTVRQSRRDYLFAIEEPEIYLHPHANRVLLNILEEIAGHDQVLFTTHSSEFVNRTPLTNILTLYRDRVGSRVVQPKLTHLAPDTLVKVQRYLQEDRSDMLFARAVILVEGQAEYYALPAFARTLGLNLDRAGVSVVFVNGIGNFPTYHEILAAFQIPHVILMDGDGQQAARQRSHAHMADALFVLPNDFEHQLVGALTPARLLALMNECLGRRGKPLRSDLEDSRRRAKELANLGKPLVGRVAGELLAKPEIREMPLIVGTLQGALTLAHNGSRIER